MLKLRRARVTSIGEADQRLVRHARSRSTVDETRDGDRLPGADRGRSSSGDEVVVNMEARDLGLGSGGFDVVHCESHARAGRRRRPAGAHVMKLNYTSLQHAVEPVEEGLEQPLERPRRCRSAVLALHGQLPCAAFAVAHAAARDARCGYVQTAGGALPGPLSDTVADMLERGAARATTSRRAPCFGGGYEAITVEGALARRGAAAGLGLRARRARPGHPRLGLRARARRAGRACGRARGAVARLSGGARSAAVQRATRASATAASAITRAPCWSCCCAPVRVPVPAGLSLPSGAGLELALAHETAHEAVRRRRRRARSRPILRAGLPAAHDGPHARRGPDFFLPRSRAACCWRT